MDTIVRFNKQKHKMINRFLSKFIIRQFCFLIQSGSLSVQLYMRCVFIFLGTISSPQSAHLTNDNASTLCFSSLLAFVSPVHGLVLEHTSPAASFLAFTLAVFAAEISKQCSHHLLGSPFFFFFQSFSGAEKSQNSRPHVFLSSLEVIIQQLVFL